MVCVCVQPNIPTQVVRSTHARMLECHPGHKTGNVSYGSDRGSDPCFTLSHPTNARGRSKTRTLRFCWLTTWKSPRHVSFGITRHSWHPRRQCGLQNSHPLGIVSPHRNAHTHHASDMHAIADPLEHFCGPGPGENPIWRPGNLTMGILNPACGRPSLVYAVPLQTSLLFQSAVCQ